VSDVSRREFLGAASGLAAGAVLGVPSRVTDAPAVHIRPPSKNVAIASGNGLRAVARTGELLGQGMDTLDAAIEGVKIQELDPKDHSVGYGGLPNEDGVVQLDASCMHGPTHRAGAVGALEDIMLASVVAKYVMLYTDHIMLVGEGAKRFALSMGFEKVNMLTDEAREIWLHWRANRSSTDDWRNISDDTVIVPKVRHGTINCNAVNTKGEISSVTTTAGVAFKVPGRVGDSAIVGAGQYTDNDVGAAGSTGLGEANIKVCGGFFTVENMRRGMKPTDACLATLKRVLTTTEADLMNERGRPKFQLDFYAVNKQGEYGAASLYPSTYAVWDGEEAKLLHTATLFDEQ
jgi:N4-(beta-N-acetylglucosaminyl)-L-asparaginase